MTIDNMGRATLNELMDMNVGECLHDDFIRYDIIRVPGGWIYSTWPTCGEDDAILDSGVFVPTPSGIE